MKIFFEILGYMIIACLLGLCFVIYEVLTHNKKRND